MISQKAATLTELQTVYGLEDLFDLLEVLMVDNHNLTVLNRSPHGDRH